MQEASEPTAGGSSYRRRDLLDAVGDAVFVIDHEGIVVEVNLSACRALGYSQEELVGKRVSEFDVEMDCARVREIIRALPEGERLPFETVHRHASGRTFPVEVLASPVEVNGRLGSIAVARDLTARKEAESHLAQSETRMRAIVEHEPECVKILDASYRLLEMNPAGLKLIGAESMDEVRGVSTLELVAPEYHELFVEGVRQVFLGKKTFQEFEIIALDGTRRWMEQHAVPLWDPKDPNRVNELLAVTRDITERKRSEQQTLHKQRLEALGTLAGGIAHDINNLLTPIMLSIDELAGLSQERRDLVDTLESSVLRASGMVKQLLSFARGLEGERKRIVPRELVEELTRMLRATLPVNIQLEVAYAEDLGQIYGDETQLHQVLLNLCVNARDAMPGGGRLSIDVKRVTLRTDQGAPAPGAYVAFIVRDTGTGMSAAVRERIFDPFFTTKGEDNGTGLGLSSALGVVRSSRGFITVDSEEGTGSTFCVYLPAIAELDGENLRRRDTRAIEGRGRKVVVVDDEEAVREVVAQALIRLGFEVTRMASGAAALTYLHANHGDLDLLISDLRMPGMSGSQLVREVRRLAPRAGAILMTGHTDDEALELLKDIPGLWCLEKPFAIEALQRSLREVLPPEPVRNAHREFEAFEVARAKPGARVEQTGGAERPD